uniref:Uncharacterized protein n=1 Tax=Amphimedon queenslandica TaxID=400682 RepID=A0A1X7V960_AMPQE
MYASIPLTHPWIILFHKLQKISEDNNIIFTLEKIKGSKQCLTIINTTFNERERVIMYNSPFV